MSSRAAVALLVCVVLGGAWPFTIWTEQRWVDEFNRAQSLYDCCQMYQLRCEEPLRHLRFAAAGVGDPAYVARLLMIECAPPPEVQLESVATLRAEEAARAIALAKQAEQQAKPSQQRTEEEQARAAVAATAELERVRTLVPSAAAGCALLPPEPGPAIALAALATLPPLERDLRLRAAVCRRAAETRDALLALSGEARREVLCALPWRAALSNNLQEFYCAGTDPTQVPSCTFLDPVDAGPDKGGDEAPEACPQWPAIEAAFRAGAEQRMR